MKRLLMINPNFPRPYKSKNHSDLIPIGLLKIGAYYIDQGHEVMLVNLGEEYDQDFEPTEIKVTSLYTYYSKYVIEAVQWAREHYPDVPIEVGGVWASLMPDKCKELTGADSVFEGVCHEAENYPADYSLLDGEIDFQILHTQRGCHRRCDTCGVYCIEPELEFKESIKDLIQKKRIIFYDNNLLLNPNIENILRELAVLKNKKIIKSCESQSGFDGRILRAKPYLAEMLKRAGFVKIKVAWDGSIKNWKSRKEEIELFKNVGYSPRLMSVFMLYNHEQTFEELENKRRMCWDWGVQVTNCRYRPLDALDDQFHGRKKNQTTDDYYIHPNWTDAEVKKFNQNVRRHNMCLRFNTLFHSRKMQYKKISKELSNFCRKMTPEEASEHLDDVWNPADFHGVDES